MKFSSVVVVDLPIGGNTTTTSLLREIPGNPDNPLPGEGWTLSEDIAGVVAVKGERCVLVPWARVVMAEVAAEVKKAPAGGGGAPK